MAEAGIILIQFDVNVRLTCNYGEEIDGLLLQIHIESGHARFLHAVALLIKVTKLRIMMKTLMMTIVTIFLKRLSGKFYPRWLKSLDFVKSSNNG